MKSKKRLIRVFSCSECPFNGNCSAFKALTRSQVVLLNLSNSVPVDFMLKDCPLEVDEAE